MNDLHFRIEPDEDGTCKLSAELAVAEFAGRGGAWFGMDELRSFGERVMAFPLRPEAPPSITGGFGGVNGKPEQIHLAVALAPHNALGELRVTVRLATEGWNDEAEDLVADMTVRLLVTYGDLGRFGPEFLDLLEGRTERATLRSWAGR